MNFEDTTFGDLKAQDKIKWPFTGKGSRIGTIINVAKGRGDVSILVRWADDESVQTACAPSQKEIRRLV